ncbi:MAG: hypothetical protein ABSF70_19800 [Terracidiphilus sp.]|jgi:hypothetical protein
MATSPYPPAKDPEKIPDPSFEEPDYNEPVEDPDSGELLPEDEPDEDEDEDIPDDEPLKV